MKSNHVVHNQTYWQSSILLLPPWRNKEWKVITPEYSGISPEYIACGFQALVIIVLF